MLVQHPQSHEHVKDQGHQDVSEIGKRTCNTQKIKVCYEFGTGPVPPAGAGRFLNERVKHLRILVFIANDRLKIPMAKAKQIRSLNDKEEKRGKALNYTHELGNP